LLAPNFLHPLRLPNRPTEELTPGTKRQGKGITAQAKKLMAADSPQAAAAASQARVKAAPPVTVQLMAAEFMSTMPGMQVSSTSIAFMMQP
jgi:hypothetical protein